MKSGIVVHKYKLGDNATTEEMLMGKDDLSTVLHTGYSTTVPYLELCNPSSIMSPQYLGLLYQSLSLMLMG